MTKDSIAGGVHFGIVGQDLREGIKSLGLHISLYAPVYPWTMSILEELQLDVVSIYTFYLTL